MTDVVLTGEGVGEPPPPPAGTECHPVAPTWMCDPVYAGNYHSTGYWAGFVTRGHNASTDATADPQLDGCGPGTRFNEGPGGGVPGWFYGATYGGRCIGFEEPGFGRRGGWYVKFRFNDANMLDYGGGQHLMNFKSNPQNPGVGNAPDITSRWDVNQPKTTSGGSIRFLIRWKNGGLSDGSSVTPTTPYGREDPTFAVPSWGQPGGPTSWVWFFVRWKHRTLSDREVVDLWFNNSDNGSDTYSAGDSPTFTFSMALGAAPMGNIWQLGHIERKSGSPLAALDYKIHVDEWGTISRPT